MALSPRLTLVAALVPNSGAVADIGADHGLLALALAARPQRVIAGEYGDGPYRRLCRELERHGGGLDVEARQGDGLQILRPGEAATVVLAGLGGDSIVAILQRDRGHAETMGRYIFQPMSRSRALRELLYGWGWEITDEQPVWEQSRPWVVIAARPACAPARKDDLELELGAALLVPEQRRYLLYHRRRFLRLVEGLKLSDEADARARQAIYEERIKRLEMIIDGSYPA